MIRHTYLKCEHFEPKYSGRRGLLLWNWWSSNWNKWECLMIFTFWLYRWDINYNLKTPWSSCGIEKLNWISDIELIPRNCILSVVIPPECIWIRKSQKVRLIWKTTLQQIDNSSESNLFPLSIFHMTTTKGNTSLASFILLAPLSKMLMCQEVSIKNG